ncbi:MAG TPA: DUF2892 domain-containing protein [bacterium]|nr:DUF2892 domain-containing protein [Candidatus Omnitrophota bacterium]HOJ59162.1 DUF2892 domain-containing protein [bacterium]HOL92740.1 DUF2892 domain-containing protein [bacterium]HPO99045.1 DUF2892 domain-containing protein [bacterium]HXK95424.1 DUF2892 domain-containing protein [bacterium]
MTTEKIVRIAAGFFVMASVALGLLHSPWWFAFTLFVGLNLFQSGFTNFCPLELILRKMNIPRCPLRKENHHVE